MPFLKACEKQMGVPPKPLAVPEADGSVVGQGAASAPGLRDDLGHVLLRFLVLRVAEALESR